MKIFNKLSELDNYIPNCLICKKPMQIILRGVISHSSHHRDYKSYQKLKLVFFKTDDNCYYIKTKEKNTTNIKVQAVDNLVVEGSDLVAFLKDLKISKGCPTCHFRIETALQPILMSGPKLNNKINVDFYFPSLTLQREELHLTLRGGNSLMIDKIYYAAINEDSVRTMISLNHKYLSDIPLELDKISDLDQLNKKIGMIKTFH